MRGKVRHDPFDRAIRAIAEEQHGIVTRSQLSELGLGSDAIDHRLSIGRLCPIHRGVFSMVGRRLLTRHGFWMAAVLACGPGAVLSYRAAAALWGVRGGGWTEVTVPRGRKARQGIRLHFADLPADETTVHHGIPVTTIARTLLDLSAVVQQHELRSAFRQAEQLQLRDPLGIAALIARYPRRPGGPLLKAAFEEAQLGLSVTRSELEERFQALLLDAALPGPATNVRIEGHEVDCAWPDERLIVELDGRGFHDSGDAFEADRARDRRLEAAGWRVVRITWGQVTREARDVERDLRRLLGLGPRRARRGRRTRAASGPG
jgi:very-short-patch-repair endonuclease